MHFIIPPSLIDFFAQRSLGTICIVAYVILLLLNGSSVIDVFRGDLPSFAVWAPSVTISLVFIGAVTWFGRQVQPWSASDHSLFIFFAVWSGLVTVAWLVGNGSGVRDPSKLTFYQCGVMTTMSPAFLLYCFWHVLWFGEVGWRIIGLLALVAAMVGWFLLGAMT